MSLQMLTPQQSGEHIVKHAKYLQILPSGIDKLAAEIIAGVQSKKIDVANFSQHELHPKPEDKYAVEWIFLVDALNFCFWTPTDYTKYKVDGYTGYFALCAAINRAMREGIDITSSKYYAQLDLDSLKHIFRSDDGVTQVPLLEKRLACLHEVGKRLQEKWNGEFKNVVEAAAHSAERLLQLIVNEFPCFRDEAIYAGQRVALYKRAQILIGDLWSCFRGEGLGQFNDLQTITMFADYRIPQVLVHFGCLQYSDELLQTLKADTILQNGEQMEVEIRGASIYIVEQVKELVLKQLPQNDMINSILIDQFLWDYRREFAQELEHIPFHKTLSIYY